MDWVPISVLNGVSLGTILFLLATGLSLTLGLMGIVNLAHGAFFMIGGYVGWTVAVQLEFNYWLAVLAGGITAGIVGVVIERGFLRRIHGQALSQALLTVGFVYVLTNLTLLGWGAGLRQPFTSPLLAGTLPIAGWQYPIFRIATIAIGLVLFIGLWWFQEKTKLGAIVRAGMDDKQMVIGMGINLGKVNYLVFSLGAFIAGVAGVIGSQIMVLNPGLGFDILLLALVVVIVGGTGSVQGAFAGAMVIGLIDAFGKFLVPEIARYLLYLVMLVVLLIRPSGLIPRK